jgi:glycosyltransferase involved in cell wall biosynthesis
MREAFAGLGATCIGIDEPESDSLTETLADYLKQGPIDLIYERYALGKSATARFAAEHGIPLVLEVNAPLSEEQDRWRGGSDETEDASHDAFVMRTACKVISVSSDVARYAILRGADADRVQVLPNGIDVDRFNPGIRVNSVRGSFFPADRFVIGFHGRLRPWHGFDMLLAVVRKLLEQGRNIHLLVVGEGEFEGLDQLPGGRYSRLGWQAHHDVPKFVAAFDALPLTYHADLPCYFSPLKLMEAMACGVVPLVPDLGDLATVVKHRETGLVYRADDQDQLLRGLELLIEDKTMRDEIAHRAALKAGHHSWKKIASVVFDSAAEYVAARGSSRH